MSVDEEIITCPLGSECREIKDGKMHRCRWYQKHVGVDAQGKEHDEFDCAINWMPLLTIEMIRNISGTQSAVESLRNEHVKALREQPVQSIKVVE